MTQGPCENLWPRKMLETPQKKISNKTVQKTEDLFVFFFLQLQPIRDRQVGEGEGEGGESQ